MKRKENVTEIAIDIDLEIVNKRYFKMILLSIKNKFIV